MLPPPSPPAPENPSSAPAGASRPRLEGAGVAPALKGLCDTRATGILTVRGRTGHVETVSLLTGSPVFASSTNREHRLSALLMRLGFVPLPAMVRAVERMLRENRRLGEVLVGEGLLAEDHLTDALRLQIREIICAVLGLEGPRLSFREQPVPPHDDIGFSLPVNTLIREGLFRVNVLHRILDEIGGLSAVYTLSERAGEEVAAAALLPAHREALPLFRTPVSLEQACLSLSLPDFDVCRLVWVLLSIGALRRLE